VEVASDKEEYAARTIRPKIHEHLDDYLVPLRRTAVQHGSLDLPLEGIDLGDVDALLGDLDVDRSVAPSPVFRGGTSEATKRLRSFVSNKLKDYHEKSSDPAADCVSDMSPYLHFGQISPLYVALQVMKHRGRTIEARDAYLEQLVVRRELSMNFVAFNPDYDRYDAVPGWAQKTLAEHEADGRDVVYSRDELERAATHDRYWNAAQREMAVTGKMHNYMRMYWGKKIIEWTETPREAFRIALSLNNKYELDGRDPNGFTGVAWCFGKHDRAWGEREIFGKVRYMSAGGLERKFDIDAYVDRVDAMEDR
ncbi:MAG: deoxyribodipyrimidine photolyase, partial [Planctomycetota bacterium]